MTKVQTRDIPDLNWDVLVTPGIPIVTNDLPPTVTQAKFQAIASTLIYGKQEAVLVDAYMTVKQTDALADWVAASGKNLTTIYITHGHGDHWFGIGALLERFRNAKTVATPNVVSVMRQHASPKLLERVWKALSWPDPRPARDGRGAQRKCNKSLGARLGRSGTRSYRH
jgi:glyoxylase-like metal-dependent hydrolase (beta-lactamase superfamily II)